MSVRVPHCATASPRRQAGFGLLEASISVVLLGITSLAALQFRQFEQSVDSGRQAGLTLAALGEGAQSFARDHSDKLWKIRNNASCEQILLTRSPATATPVSDKCALTNSAGTRVAVNAFQPTIQELKDLGYVHFDDRLPFPHGKDLIDGRTGKSAEARWAISIRCSNCGNASAPSLAAGAVPALEVMLYNTQPFFPHDARPFSSSAQLKAAMQALGPGGLVSLPHESPQAAKNSEAGPGSTCSTRSRDSIRERARRACWHRCSWCIWTPNWSAPKVRVRVRVKVRVGTATPKGNSCAAMVRRAPPDGGTSIARTSSMWKSWACAARPSWKETCVSIRA
ncbi:type II secretion system protein [Roseateles chitinivorans]|uniref:type II secretion system protein n=1 Tax=Roseateles chitinivorans TaxID=2917965 RepID=UPI003D667D6D